MDILKFYCCQYNLNSWFKCQENTIIAGFYSYAVSIPPKQKWKQNEFETPTTRASFNSWKQKAHDLLISISDPEKPARKP